MRLVLFGWIGLLLVLFQPVSVWSAIIVTHSGVADFYVGSTLYEDTAFRISATVDAPSAHGDILTHHAGSCTFSLLAETGDQTFTIADTTQTILHQAVGGNLPEIERLFPAFRVLNDGVVVGGYNLLHFLGDDDRSIWQQWDFSSDITLTTDRGGVRNWLSGEPATGKVLNTNDDQKIWLSNKANAELTFTIEGFANEPIPEPTSLTIWSAIALGGLGLAYRRRKRGA